MPFNRREFLKAGIAAGGLSLSDLAQAPTPRRNRPLSIRAGSAGHRPSFSVSIREYLCREAQEITARALADYKDAATWKRLVPERRQQFLEMMGLDGVLRGGRRLPLNVKVTGVVDRPLYRIEKLYYESLPKLYVTANLYVPKQLESRAPGVLYVCGHAVKQKVHYQAHPRRLAELGFVCLLVETVQRGEGRGYHHGPYYEGWFHWYSRGYTPAGIELLNAIRALDLLEERSDVDRGRLGVTGISGGGVTTWWLAAADERIKVAAPVCGTSTLASYIGDLTVDGNCDCIWWNNTYRWDLADVGALIAPRPLLIAYTFHDDVFAGSSVRDVYDQLGRLYRLLGVPDKLRLVGTPGGHGYQPRSRTEIFSWFLAHLQGKNVRPEKVGDVDESPQKQESEETLRVFVSGSPVGNRTPTIHEELLTPAAPPHILDVATLEQTRQRTIASLREKTFGAFPSFPPPLEPVVEFEFMGDNGEHSYRFAFRPEDGWRLRGLLTVPAGARPPLPAVVALRSPGEKRDGTGGATEDFLGRLRVPWAKVVVEPRGTGETAWGEELQWHVRRAAAWTGRTLASMRVYDTLRALEAIRSFPQVNPSQVALAARGEMAAVALYAALLDGRVRALILQSPPATQNAPSQRDGRGPAIEMLNCLQITDLAQVAGLLYPTELAFVGDYPVNYSWAEDLYKKLGAPTRFQRRADLSTWHPA